MNKTESGNGCQTQNINNLNNKNMNNLFFGIIAMVKYAFEGSKKSFALGASVIALAVLVSAYTVQEKKESGILTQASFLLDPNEDPTDPTNWAPTNNMEGECPQGTDRCGIAVSPEAIDSNGDLKSSFLIELDNIGSTTHESATTVAGAEVTFYNKR